MPRLVDAKAIPTNRVPATKTIAISTSLALGQDRFSSVSNTSFNAARSPPNIRVENHRNRAAPSDQVAERALDEAELTGLPTAGLGEEAFEQLVDVELVIGELVLGEVADDGQDEPHEGDGREQNVERDGAGEKRNVVFVGGLESAPDDAGDRAVPAAFRIHASGSSSSSDAGAGDTGGLVARARRRRAAPSRRRRCSRVAIFGSSSSSSSDSSDAACSSASFSRPRTSSTFSSASSFKLRRPLVTLRRVLSPPSVGANTNPATAPSTMPNRKAPNPPPRSLIRRPPRHPVPTRARRAARRVTRVSV